MNLKIEINEVPEFDNNLKITITLQKDENGSVGGNVNFLPDTVRSYITPVPRELVTSDRDLEDEVKKENVKNSRGKKAKISGAGNDAGAKVSSISEASKPTTSLSESMSSQTSEQSTPAPQSKKVSGNLMDLDF